jgi:hypothetical protein
MVEFPVFEVLSSSRNCLSQSFCDGLRGFGELVAYMLNVKGLVAGCVSEASFLEAIVGSRIVD